MLNRERALLRRRIFDLVFRKKRKHLFVSALDQLLIQSDSDQGRYDAFRGGPQLMGFALVVLIEILLQNQLSIPDYENAVDVLMSFV